VINEWMADNVGPGGFRDSVDGLFQDWFELFNPNDVPVDLSGYRLTDNLLVPTKWSIPTNTAIPARGFLLVWADEDGVQNSPTNADLHANFRLNNGGESLGLFSPDGLSPQHAVTFGTQFANVSQGLFPDGMVGSSFLMTNWTPRAPNQLGLPAAPVISGVSFNAAEAILSFQALPGRTYRIEFTDDLETLEWIEDNATHTAVNGVITVNLPGTALPQRFFRVRLQ